MQLQQGDVILKKIENLPNGLKEVPKKRGTVILAEGEATGHAHRIFVDHGDDLETMFYEKDGKFYLKNSKEMTVTHEEHKSITIEPGIWEVGRVKEKDWLSGMVRKVVD